MIAPLPAGDGGGCRVSRGAGVRRHAADRLEWCKRRIMDEAARLVNHHTDPLDRLAALTPLAANAGEPRYLFSTADREMGPQIYRNAGYDAEEIEWTLDYLGHPQRGGQVVEVGANVGTTTIPLLTRYGAAAIEAFEPTPMNFKLLRCNLILNDLEDRATVHQFAISDEDAELTLELCEWNCGDSRVVAVDSTWEEMWESERATVRVAGRCLDHVLARPEEVSLFWVDTQGHEARVLGGASGVLGDSGAPWVIEYWPYGLTRAGGLERLHRLIAEHFTAAVDVRRSMERGRPVVLGPDGVAGMAERPGVWYTDLILLR